MTIPTETCRDFFRSSKLEWLETNGTGAFAMGTVAGVNTRRYHGLLVASLRPPVERYVMLSRVEEEIDGRFALGASQYPGVVAPQGYEFLSEFRIEPCATWTFTAGAAELLKQVWMIEGQQAVAIQYTASRAMTLRVRPFFAVRDYHSLAHANDSWNRRVDSSAGGWTIRPYESLPALTLWADGAEFLEQSEWYRNIEYLAELDRGLEFREDQYTPGVLSVTLAPNQPWTVICAVGEQRPETALPRARKHPADEFRVRRADGKPTIIAGYPWFTDWGRDTMISLPGLLLTRGRADLREEAREIIQGFLANMDRGLIPNRFPDAGETPEYNTCDATLWMFQAVHAYEQAGGDPSFFFEAAREILDWHLRGTHYNIGVDPADHLLHAGFAGTQLTWMDAKVGDWVVTPRQGKPVEINALWYNALKLSARWLKDDSFEAEAGRAAASYTRFWNPARDCLFDVLDGDPAATAKLRPNQILAVSLPYSPLPVHQQKSIVRIVEQELLTPFGLRTLDRNDPDYKPHYGGGPLERDGAYHQGTVWPWLIGPFVEAYLRAFGRTADALAYARTLLAPLESQFDCDGLGSLAEVYDAEPPHRAGGCPAQAWSVSEWLRADQLCNR